jgi:hypothetical protein
LRRCRGAGGEAAAGDSGGDERQAASANAEAEVEIAREARVAGV